MVTLCSFIRFFSRGLRGENVRQQGALEKSVRINHISQSAAFESVAVRGDGGGLVA